MLFNSRFVIMGVLILFVSTQAVRGQSTEKFEVGGQFSVLQLSIPARTTLVSLTGCNPTCPVTVIEHQRDAQLGFGGRVGYNVNNNFAVEAEVNFFPSVETVGANFLDESHNLQGLFGVKFGKRFEKAGIFAKARPGFLSQSKGDLQFPTQGVVCIAIFPPPVGCFQAVSKTHFAFDVGGVVELYPSKRTVIRFDAGDTIVHFGERRVPVVLSTHIGAISVTAETTHNFQASVGVAYRF